MYHLLLGLCMLHWCWCRVKFGDSGTAMPRKLQKRTSCTSGELAPSFAACKSCVSTFELGPRCQPVQRLCCNLQQERLPQGADLGSVQPRLL